MNESIPAASEVEYEVEVRKVYAEAACYRLVKGGCPQKFQIAELSSSGETHRGMSSPELSPSKAWANAYSRLPKPTPSERGKEKSGAELIQEERLRQVSVEGWTPEHDDEHTNQSIAIAAACYALPDSMREHQSYIVEHAENGGRDLIGFIPKLWPWAAEYWKPSDRIRELVKAGALLAAEIDRRQRLARGGTQ